MPPLWRVFKGSLQQISGTYCLGVDHVLIRLARHFMYCRLGLNNPRLLVSLFALVLYWMAHRVVPHVSPWRLYWHRSLGKVLPVRVDDHTIPVRRRRTCAQPCDST